MLRKTVLPVILLVGLSAATPSDEVDGEFHFALSKSAPAADASVESPSEIRLWFTEAPDAGTTAIRLIGADEAAIETGDIMQDDDEERSFGVALQHALGGGIYAVAWRAMGADGHVVRGSYEFTVVAQ